MNGIAQKQTPISKQPLFALVQYWPDSRSCKKDWWDWVEAFPMYSDIQCRCEIVLSFMLAP